MAAIALPPPPAALVRSILEEWIPESQGIEGRQVEAAAREVATHWAARPSCLIEADDAEQVFAYEPVPLRVVGTARVNYRYAGRIEPRPYPLDE
jgi:hypothetical protein